MPDQADMLRRLARSAAGNDTSSAPLRLLLVCSGKGGVGATTVAVQLAHALAQLGRGSVLVDADLGHADATSLLGLAPRDGLDALLEGRCGLEAVLTTLADGMRVLPAPWAPSHPCQPTLVAGRRLVSELRQLPSDSGWIVVDGGSRQSPLCDCLWQQANRVLMVTAVDDVSVMDTYARIKSLTAAGATTPISVLVNRASQSALALDVQARLEVSCRRFLGLTVAAGGQIPHLAALAASDGRPAALPAREPGAMREFVRLARRLSDVTQEHSTITPKQPMMMEPVGAPGVGSL